MRMIGPARYGGFLRTASAPAPKLNSTAFSTKSARSGQFLRTQCPDIGACYDSCSPDLASFPRVEVFSIVGQAVEVPRPPPTFFLSHITPIFTHRTGFCQAEAPLAHGRRARPKAHRRSA